MDRVFRWLSSLYYPIPISDQITIGKKHPTLHRYFICNTCVYNFDDVKTLSITDPLINLCDWTSSWTFSRRIVFLIKKRNWNFDVRQKWSKMTSEMMRSQVMTSLMMKKGWMEHRGCNGWSEINHFVTSWLFLLIHWCKPSMVALFVTDLSQFDGIW